MTKFSLIYSGTIKYRKLTIPHWYPLDSLVPSCSLPEYCFLFLIDLLTAHDQVPSMNVRKAVGDKKVIWTGEP